VSDLIFYGTSDERNRDAERQYFYGFGSQLLTLSIKLPSILNNFSIGLAKVKMNKFYAQSCSSVVIVFCFRDLGLSVEIIACLTFLSRPTSRKAGSTWTGSRPSWRRPSRRASGSP
jgi:hypothetical protein